MPIIHEIKLDEIIANLPQVQCFGTQLADEERPCILVAAAGFEDRSRWVAEQTRDYPWHKILVIVYPTNEIDNEPGLQAFQSMASYSGDSLLLYERSTFWSTLQASLSKIAAEDESYRIVVDLSGMASYVLYPVFEAVRRFIPKSELTVLYVEADHYHPRKSDWDAFKSEIKDLSNSLEVAERFQKSGSFESRGPNFVYASPLFPGDNPVALATQLIAIPSFGLERIKEMIAYADEQSNVGRDDIRWIFGEPPNQEKNGWRLDALIDLFRAAVVSPHATASTMNYTETFRLLQEIWKESRCQRHLAIATVGSKMQHMATFLFLCNHPETTLILSEPQEFKASQYSEGIGDAWWLDFGSIAELVLTLQKLGKLEFQW
jgi:hypothetical protein